MKKMISCRGSLMTRGGVTPSMLRGVRLHSNFKWAGGSPR
jgi:hypothetical protein